jgi:hypothetical protein
MEGATHSRNQQTHSGDASIQGCLDRSTCLCNGPEEKHPVHVLDHAWEIASDRQLVACYALAWWPDGVNAPSISRQGERKAEMDDDR